MKTLPMTEVVSIGLMMFSIFFGAGNLIFPTLLGQLAGDNLFLAIIGFLLTGVGLPLLGVVAIARKGGEYTRFMDEHISPVFTVGLLALLYLMIGPLFAAPRTGAVSFEIGIRPFLAESSLTVGQAIYTGVFFLLTYYLALNPSKLVARVGKLLTPILLIFLAVLFVEAFIHPLGDIIAVNGPYSVHPFAQGFKDGYLTMDLLASIAIGAIVVQSVKAAGVTDKGEIRKICLLGGVIASILMGIVYLSIGYLGATSASILGVSENGGVILTKASAIFFGSLGQVVLAVIIGFACLTTSVGVLSASSSYFHELSKKQVSYQRFLFFSVLFSFITSNVGLTSLISFSVPFLVAMYPLVIVLVLLSLVDDLFGEKKEVYVSSLAVTLLFSVFDGVKAFGFEFPLLEKIFTAYIPLYEGGLGWFIPSIVGALVGFGYSFFRMKEDVKLVSENEGSSK